MIIHIIDFILVFDKAADVYFYGEMGEVRQSGLLFARRSAVDVYKQKRLDIKNKIKKDNNHILKTWGIKKP